MADNRRTNLLDLVCLGFVPSRLKIQDLGNAVARKDVVTTADPFLESEVPKQHHQLSEANVRITCAAQDAIESLACFAHE
jgi:hypothetical protein